MSSTHCQSALSPGLLVLAAQPTASAAAARPMVVSWPATIPNLNAAACPMLGGASWSLPVTGARGAHPKCHWRPVRAPPHRASDRGTGATETACSFASECNCSSYCSDIHCKCKPCNAYTHIHPLSHTTTLSLHVCRSCRQRSRRPQPLTQRSKLWGLQQWPERGPYHGACCHCSGKHACQASLSLLAS